MKKLLALLALAAFCFCGFSQSETNYAGHFGHSNSAVRQYVKEHIMPVLIEKRQLVEKELTTAEKSDLATYRTTLKQLFAQRKEQLQQKPGGVSMREYMHSDEQRALEKQSHQQMKQIMEKVQVIANSHLATLDNIHGQLEPSRKQWTDDITKLRANANVQNHPSHGGGGPGMGANMFEGQKAYAHFLLLPANATTTASTDEFGDLESLMAEEPATTSGGALTFFQVLPNPAINELITGNGQLPSENEFKLLDIQGRTVLSLQNIQPAQHIDVSHLPSGTYLAQLTANDQSQQSKIVISH